MMSLCRRLRGWRWRSTGGRIVSEDAAFGSLSPVGGFTHFGGVVGVIVVRAGGISWTWTHPRGRRRRWPRVSRSFRWVAPREPARRRSRRARPRAPRTRTPTGGSRTWECARFVDGAGARGTRGRRRRPRGCACRGKIRASDTRRDDEDLRIGARPDVPLRTGFGCWKPRKNHFNTRVCDEWMTHNLVRK